MSEVSTTREFLPHEIALLDQKLHVALGIGIEETNRRRSTEILYDTVFTPTAFASEEAKATLSNPAYPERMTLLRAELPGVMPAVDRETFIRSTYLALTRSGEFASTAQPGAIQALEALLPQGRVGLWSQGDELEQLHKITDIGIGDLRRRTAVAQGAALSPHELRRHLISLVAKDKVSDESLGRLAHEAEGCQLFIADDRFDNLAKAAAGLKKFGIEPTLIWVQQGRHGHRTPKEASEEDLARIHRVSSIAELPQKVAELRDQARPPFFALDYDGVLSNDDQRLAIQKDIMRRQLVWAGVPQELAQPMGSI